MTTQTQPQNSLFENILNLLSVLFLFVMIASMLIHFNPDYSKNQALPSIGSGVSNSRTQ